MSSFFCQFCNTAILEDKQGNYFTECEHFPMERYEAGFDYLKFLEEKP